ncbi:MAG TPA: carbohydrate-binding family 9-like protein [Planctomycetota bacterium]|nr:carbohydrate-binding family 9-like protein [Planctomycetota bacterium]
MSSETSARPSYVVTRAAPAGLDDPAWDAIPALTVGSFHPRSSAHRPPVTARLAHDGAQLHVRFDVDDRWVLARRTGYQVMVCNDACVEIFLEPVPGRGYLNVEMNAGGAILCYHITDPARRPGGFAAFAKLSEDELRQIAIATSLPHVVDPEIADPVSWRLSASIPFDLMAARIGAPVAATGTWRANLFKCADESSHPHWASWSPIGEPLNFHQPDRFGELRFAP